MDNRAGFAALAALWLACATPGGGKAPPPAQSGLEDRVRALEDQLERARADLAALHAGGQGDREGRDGQQGRILEELARLRQDVDGQAGRVEVLGRAVEQLRADTARQDASPPVAQPPQRAPERRRRPPPGGTGASAAPSQPDAIPTGLSPDQAEVFKLARDQELKGERGVAREVYEQYLAKWPRDPSAAEVHFRLGELAFDDHRDAEAIGEYGTVAREFPASPRAPDALLRTAEAMNRASLGEDAERVLAELIKRYPNTPAAARARAGSAGAGPGKKTSR